VSAERFAAIPERFTNALQAGELTLREFGLGCYLVATANHVTRALHRQLAALAAEAGYGTVKEKLSRDLKSLEAGGWITLRVRQGQRSAWKITLRGLRRDFGIEIAAGTEVTSPPSSGNGRPTVGLVPDGAGSRPLHGREQLDVDVDVPPFPPATGGTGRRRSKSERREERFKASLSETLRKSFESLSAPDRAQLCDLYRQSTGLRRARGSYGSTWKADPLGTDRPPTGPERSQLPLYEKPSPDEFLLTWLDCRELVYAGRESEGDPASTSGSGGWGSL
jgi:hypothetical protein